MYTALGKENVVPVAAAKKPAASAPMPVVLASELKLAIAYYTDNAIAIVSFDGYKSYMFGGPNDESLSGHPLYKAGLKHYDVMLVKNSPWIWALEKINSVHPHHNEKWIADLKHFIITFQDSTFECVAENFRTEIFHGEQMEILPRLGKLVAV